MASLYIAAEMLAMHERHIYYSFETDSGHNTLCDIDPTCRNISSEEIARAQEIFGDTIDYTNIKIFSRPLLRELFSPATALASGNYIYEHPSFNDLPAQIYKNAVHVHELHHVWQHQNLFDGGHVTKERGHDDIYHYDAREFETFLEYGIEQQATMVEMIYLYQNVLLGDTDLRHGYENDYAACIQLNDLEEMAAQMLPIEVTDCEARYGQPANPAPEI